VKFRRLEQSGLRKKKNGSAAQDTQAKLKVVLAW
jgi:hypothetical protein